jgi:hypothetical protein
LKTKAWREGKMSKAKKVESSTTVTDKSAAPDLSKIPIEIDGKTFNLSFEFTELAKAERLFRSQGHRLNLLLALPGLSLESVREVFPCAVHRHHPDLTFAEAQSLVTMQSVYPIATAIVQAFDGSGTRNAALVPAE